MGVERELFMNDDELSISMASISIMEMGRFQVSGHLKSIGIVSEAMIS